MCPGAALARAEPEGTGIGARPAPEVYLVVHALHSDQYEIHGRGRVTRSSEHEDILLRQLRAVAVILARILGLRQSGQLEEARAALDDAYGLLLDPRDYLVRRVDARTAAQILSAPERIAAYAYLVYEEAALARDAAQVTALRQRALELALEAALRGSEDARIRELVLEAARSFDARRLGGNHRAALEKILDGGWPRTGTP